MSASSRKGFSLLEVVLAITIFAIALGPLIELLGTANRAGWSARQLIEATTQGQLLLDAVGALDPSDLPPLDAGAPETRLLADGEAPRTDGSGRWQEIVAFFGIPPEAKVRRKLSARGVSDGTVLLRVEVEWLRLPERPETGDSLRLEGLITPREP